MLTAGIEVFRFSVHLIKVMVTVWWSAAGLIHDSFLNPSETISKSEKYGGKDLKRGR